MFRSHPPAWYMTWLAILLAPLPLLWLLDTGLVDSAARLVVYDAGVVAYVWWLIIVVLSTRPQWLDRCIGLPAIYGIHAVLALLAVALATFHVLQSFTMHSIIYRTGHTAWLLALGMVVYAALFMSGWLVDRLPVAAAAKRRLSRFFSHELSVWIHRLNFVVIALVLVHVHVIPRIASVTAFVVGLDLYTLLALGIYVWNKLVAPGMESRQGVVVANVSLSADTQQVTIRLTEHAQAFEPGDFYFVSFPGVRGIPAQAHPFSATFAHGSVEYERAAEKAPSEGAPDQVSADRHLTLTIKQKGDFTSQIRQVAPGSKARLEGPFGRFHRVLSGDAAHRRLVLIGMGVGIAPLVGLAQAWAGQRPITILHSAGSGDAFHYEEILTELAESNAGVSYHRHLHRYSEGDLTETLRDDVPNARFVVVGPASAVLATEKTLRRLGVPARNITDERLTM